MAIEESPHRINLPNTIEYRSSAERTKDSTCKNGFVEFETETEKYTIKRPGLSVKATSIGSGTSSNGIFYYDSKIYAWCGDTPLTPQYVGPVTIP